MFLTRWDYLVIFTWRIMKARLVTKIQSEVPLTKLETDAELGQKDPQHPRCGYRGLSVPWKSPWLLRVKMPPHPSRQDSF